MEVTANPSVSSRTTWPSPATRRSLPLSGEAVIDPDLEICDSCIHLWENSFRYHSGREVNMPKYDIGDATADATSGHRVTSMVFLENDWRWYEDGPEELRPVGETEWVASLEPPVGQPQLIKGIVGYADLALGDRLEWVLDAHEAAGKGMFRGIRYVTSLDPNLPTIHRRMPPRQLVRPEVIDGCKRLARRGLTIETYIFYHQLNEVALLADEIPDGKISIHHMAGLVGVGPYKGRWEETVDAWKRELTEIARRPNITMRIGGIGQPVFGMPWEGRAELPSSEEIADALGPVVRWAIDCLGPDRCMVESNYPADVGIPYVTLWNAYKLMTRDMPAADREAVFSGTARKFYNI